MYNENPLSPADQELERQLGQLAPVCPGINRDTLMFRAGQEASRRQVHRWRSAAVTLMVAAAVLGGQVLVPSSGRVSGPVLTATGTAPPPRSDSRNASRPLRGAIPALAEVWSAKVDYLRLRDLVTGAGVDALPVADWVAPLDGIPQSVGAGLLRRASDESGGGRWNWNAQENGDQS